MKKQISIGTKLSWSIGIVVFLLFTIFGIYVFHTQKERITFEANQAMGNHLDDLSNLVSVVINERQQRINTAIDQADYAFGNMGNLSISDTSTITIEAIDQISKKKNTTSITKLYARKNFQYNSNELVEIITKTTDAKATIL